MASMVWRFVNAAGGMVQGLDAEVRATLPYHPRPILISTVMTGVRLTRPAPLG